MLACRVREHNKTGQTVKKIENKHNDRSRFKKSQYEKQCFVSLFRRRSKESLRIHWSTIHHPSFRIAYWWISPTNSIYIYPHKRNLDALLKVGVLIKVLVFRTLSWVVARIALATDCCCCCWSIHRVPEQLVGDTKIKYRDVLENTISRSPGIKRWYRVIGIFLAMSPVCATAIDDI